MVLNHFKRILGRRVIQERSILDFYSYDGAMKYIRMKPSAVLLPKSVDEVIKIINYSNRYNIKLTLRGRGTNKEGGAISKDVLVSTAFMKNVKRKENLIKVGAGATLKDIKPFLDKDEEIFNPCFFGEPTIGGIIATNIHSRYNDIYSVLESVEAIDGTGKHYEFKGEKIKKVIGNEGILFIITSATLKVREKSYYSYTLREFDDLFEAINSLKRQESDLKGRELLSPIIAKDLGLSEKYVVIDTYESPEGEIKHPHKISIIDRKIESLKYKESSEVWIDPKYFIETLSLLEKDRIGFYLHSNGFAHIYDRSLEKFYETLLLHRSHPGGHGYGLLKKKYKPVSLRNRFKKEKEVYDYAHILSPQKI